MGVEGSDNFVVPTVSDYGTLIDLTAAGEIQGFEDAGVKFSFLDVSDGQFP